MPQEWGEAGPLPLPRAAWMLPAWTALPVTMTVRMCVLRRVWMTGALSGFSTFLITSSPHRLSSRSTVSLDGGQPQVRGQGADKASL